MPRVRDAARRQRDAARRSRGSPRSEDEDDGPWGARGPKQREAVARDLGAPRMGASRTTARGGYAAISEAT